MIEPAVAFSGFLLGLAGVGHCMGMCGGIAAALNLSGERSLRVTLSYHGGRILSYTVLGGLLGFLSGSIEMQGWMVGLRYAAGLLLIGMGFYIANWWLGMQRLERLGARLWRPVQRLSSRWLPVKHAYQAMALGLCWGLMPCGLIYSSLAWAATAQNAATSALMMLCFGLGTLPAMLAASFGAGRLQALLKRRGLKRFIAVFLIFAGLWTLYGATAHGVGMGGGHAHVHAS